MGKFFELISYQAVAGFRERHEADCEASVMLEIDGERIHTASGGTGPINALDRALREALARKYPEVGQFHLSDYTVRATNASMGTATPVEVVVIMRDDSDCSEWREISIHPNIIEASWQALVDSIDYKLLIAEEKR